MNKIRAFMFDLDGTLIDTMEDLADLAANILAQYTELTIDIARTKYLGTSGVPFREQLREILPNDSRGDEISQVFETRKIDIVSRHRLSNTRAGVLKSLRSLGLKLAVSSNSSQDFVALFGETSSFDFDLLLGNGGGLAKGKSHVDKVCDDFEIEPQEVMYIGDSLTDAKLAFECGVHFTGVTRFSRREQFEAIYPNCGGVDDVANLPKIFESWGISQ